ncbi:hypothetical protein F4779DRAFT_588547 [Xylariaceae sp. FL0662B]|nr:hypothetical protein F4779DRAFT_588547 [Xylariaceae sp. FL0662B]
MSDLSASDITGIVVGAVSGALTAVGLVISFCAWKFPKTPVGRLGNRIGKRLSLKGGNARGGDAAGTVANAGSAKGGDVLKRSNTGTRNGSQDADGVDENTGSFVGGDARGGDAVGRDATGGNASGGGVSFV